MNCGRVSNQLSAYVDRELTGAEMLQIRGHLGACDSCRAEYEALSRMKMMLGRLRTPEPGPDFVAAAVRQFEHSGSGALTGGRETEARIIPSLLGRAGSSCPLGKGWAEPLGLWSARLAASVSFFRCETVRDYAVSLAWPRLTVGATTAILAAALIHTTLIWRKPPDALVATSPPLLIQGNDPLSTQSLDYQLVSDGGTNDFFHSDPSRDRLPSGPSSLSWAPVSFQSGGFRGLR